ncbi:hypothetical protein AY601_0283 [Pedobacter cryoconitis]|uniref:Uncharacterized protein n=1 Tax=Pedobacter cryoconitis TaxID=188932 RepID=A0A127V7I1_9SPHI|nr:hypothetical protein [Pedobacter cryoconitis]AMP97250.1 hypothetical protein AY601_0283 [Pedobacter cryoconitis]
MRKQFLCKHLFLVVPIMLFLHSCKKDNVPEVAKGQLSTQSLVDIAKSSLEKQSLAGIPLISSLKSIGMAPDWSNIKTSINSENKTVLAIPLKQTTNSFSELNVIITNGLPHEVIKKYTVSNDNSILLEFYALNGALLKAGQYDATSGRFQLAKSITNSVMLYEQKNKIGSNGNLFLLLANNKTKIFTGVKTVAVNGIHDLEEVEIEGQGPTTPQIGDPQGPSTDNGYGPVDYYPVEPVPPSGGSTGSTPEAGRDTANNVQNPCINAALKMALGKNVKSEIKNLMVNTFLSGKEFNVAFYDYPFNNTKDAEAYTRFSSETNLNDLTISFNTDKMPNNSLEYNVATVYHEVLHAYLNALYGPDIPGNPMLVPVQHEYIADNYVKMLTKDLMSIFPTLLESDARNLAWGGLQNTNLFNRLAPSAKSDFIKINTLYSTKPTTANTQSKGSYCP